MRRRAVECFALAIADAHNGGRMRRVHQVLDAGENVGACRHDDPGAGRSGAGPFGIQDRFVVITVDARIGAIAGAAGGRRMDRSQRSAGIARQAECRTEGAPVRGVVEIGVFEDVDGLALAGVAGGVERIEAVDRRQIGRRHQVAAAAGGVLRFWLVIVPWRDVVQRQHPDHCRRQRRGNLRVAHIGEAGDAVDRDIVDLGVERGGDLAGGAGEVDHHAARIDRVDGKAVLLQPVGDGGDVGRRRPELGADVVGVEPVVIVGRVRVLLLGDQRLKRLFLGRRTPQLQQQMRQRDVVAHAATVVGGIARFGAGIARERNQIALVDGLGDEGLRPSARRLRSGRRADRESQCHQRSSGDAEASTRHLVCKFGLSRDFCCVKNCMIARRQAAYVVMLSSTNTMIPIEFASAFLQ